MARVKLNNLKMFRYWCIGQQSQLIHTADEAIAVAGNKPPVYSIAEIVKVLEKLTSAYECQVIFRGFQDVYLKFSKDEYIELGIKKEDLGHILPYITQVEIRNSEHTAAFAAPNLEVIAFCHVKYDEYTVDGLHVVFGEDFNPSFLENVPPMDKLTIRDCLRPSYISEIIAMLPKWPNLWHIVFHSDSVPFPKDVELLRTFVRSHGVLTNYPKLQDESELSHDLRESPLWAVLSYERLPPELLRLLIEKFTDYLE